MVRCATRLLLAIAMATAMGRAVVVHAITTAGSGPDGVDAVSRARQPHGQGGNDPRGPVNRRDAHRIDAHKIGDQGKIQDPGGKPGAKLPGGRPQSGDQKGHGTAPVAVVPPPAPKPPAPPVKESADPPPKLPRFAALKTDETNMRRGPGQRYPIDWVYKRRDLPVEVEREYDVWRYVRDPEGVQGWVHQVTLSDRRTFMIEEKQATLRADASDTAAPVALLQAGVIGRLRECDVGSKWCQVQVGGYKGYLRRDQIWGLLPDEAVAPS